MMNLNDIKYLIAWILEKYSLDHMLVLYLLGLRLQSLTAYLKKYHIITDVSPRIALQVNGVSIELDCLGLTNDVKPDAQAEKNK